MATKNVLKSKDMGDSKTLADWWKTAVTSSIGVELEARAVKILLNLASDEYSASVDPGSLPEGTQYVKIVFQQEGRVIAVHAKRARGLMVRYIAENNIKDIEGVKQFNAEGYHHVNNRSSEDCIIFDRKKQPAASAQRRKAKSDEPDGSKSVSVKRTRTSK
uniref:Uncharacterized protein n=1 Tax=Pseudictyota dubia TaxID=2749911 RepID=A0A7R9W814_9STRA